MLKEILDLGKTPEEVCRDCPELLPEVRQRWRQFQLIDAQVRTLLPGLGTSSDAGNPSSPPLSRRGNEGVPADKLPDIEGYEVQGVLGHGGVGVVYHARHLKLNRTVALKMLLAGAYAGPQELARFMREARAVAGLRCHPNIVQVYEVGDRQGLAFFTMEFVEGGNLADKLAGQPQPAHRAAELVATLADAVHHAHAHGIVHRDLKPGNILLTADGIPKITDFGLARYLDSGPQVTLSGTRLGTPSYMAPEQALGKVSAIGPATDGYALGAILYELLTGRPPFRGETVAETERQVVAMEPVPPSRLNPKTPRDLQTICLKCLHKTPGRRYATSADLAADLRRFLEGKPIRARPVGVIERAVKWARRRPAAALLSAVLIVTLAAGTGIGIWQQQQTADRRAARLQRQDQARFAIDTALKRADDFRRQERWQEALDVLDDAVPQLADAQEPPLERKLQQLQSDFRIALELDRARESNPLTPDGRIDYGQWAAEYRTAFSHTGLTIGDDTESVVAYLRESAIRDQLLAAIDSWAYLAFMLKDEPFTERLLGVARSADPEPNWRDKFRNLARWKNAEQLLPLANDAFDIAPPPPDHHLVLLALLMWKHDWDRGDQLLNEACRRRPSNFWINCAMASVLATKSFVTGQKRRWQDAAAFYHTAIALRPQSASACQGLGHCLFEEGRIEEALAAYRRGVELSPKNPHTRTRCVEALAKAGYWKDAEAICRSGPQDAPADCLPFVYLGAALKLNGRADDAAVMFRRAIEINPHDAPSHALLGTYFIAKAQHQDAVIEFQKVLEGNDPRPGGADSALANELVALGRWQEAIIVLHKSEDRQPKNSPNSPSLLLQEGRIYRSVGKSDEAAAAFEKAAADKTLRIFALDELAAVRLDQGRFTEARDTTRTILGMTPDSPLRRARQRQLELCETLLAISADLPGILEGKPPPTDATTLRCLAEWCLKHKRLTVMATRFYQAAFAAEPTLADDLESGNHLNAACAAALAGCGVGEDAKKPGDARCHELRKQALEWLTAEHNSCADRYRLGKPLDRTAVTTAMRALQANEDLAGVRDAKALAALPDDERPTWQSLWEKVSALAASDPRALIAQARNHVTHTEWERAAKCYAEAIQLEPTDDGDVWFEFAASQLLAGDRTGYRRTCAHMLGRCQPTGPMRSYLVARACTLAADSTDDPAQLSRVSAKEVEGNEDDYWALTERAALRVRSGKSREALRLLERSLAADGRPGRAILNWLWLALAQRSLGQPDDARRWLDKATNWLDQQGNLMALDPQVSGLHRHNWLEAQVLLQEVRTLARRSDASSRASTSGPSTTTLPGRLRSATPSTSRPAACTACRGI
jgi:serine/threonine-protein kinase